MLTCAEAHPEKLISIITDCDCKRKYEEFKDEYSYKSVDELLNFIDYRSQKQLLLRLRTMDIFSNAPLYRITCRLKKLDNIGPKRSLGFRPIWEAWISEAYAGNMENWKGSISPPFTYASDALIWLAFFIDRINELKEVK